MYPAAGAGPTAVLPEPLQYLPVERNQAPGPSIARTAVIQQHMSFGFDQDRQALAHIQQLQGELAAVSLYG